MMTSDLPDNPDVHDPVQSPSQPITIRDVAAQAGVSISTVSLVLSESPKVAARTRRRVEETIKRLRYVPNEYAVALRRGRKDVFAALVPDFGNPFCLGVLRGLRENCMRNGIILHISETFLDFDIERSELEFLERLHPSGYIFFSTQFDDDLIHSLNTDRVVMINKIIGGDYPQILIDNDQAMRRAVSYLTASGCRSIFLLSHPIQTHALSARLNAFLSMTRAAGLDCSGNIIELHGPTGASIENGFLVMSRLLTTRQPDAIIATSDLFALGAMRAILVAGLRIPQDISVIGFENTQEGRFHTPSLTTFELPTQRIADLAFDILIQSSEVKGRITLPADFIVRESVR